MEYFNKTYCLEVWGDYACFTRPEMKVERVSYDVITPSAARAIFEAVFWKPAIHWKVTKIEVLNPIRWTSVRRNEVAKLASDRINEIFIDEEGSRQQRAGLFLRDVAYRIHAELEFVPVGKRLKVKVQMPESLIDSDEKYMIEECAQTHETGKDENPGKYNAIFERRAKKGQCFNQPYLGCREFTANYRLVENPEREIKKPIEESCDLGFMLYDMDFKNNVEKPNAMFFKAKMENGVIEVPPVDSEEVHK